MRHKRYKSNEISTKIALFKSKKIRKTLHSGEWWFVIVDIIVALTDSSNPSQYLKNIRKRDTELELLFNTSGKGGVHFEPPLTLPFITAGGKQKILCWNTEGIFRLIQSIPSPKAEPYKVWLAKVGYERIEETDDPELAFEKAMKTYLQKGYSKDWINQRLKSIEVRKELTDKWQIVGGGGNTEQVSLRE